MNLHQFRFVQEAVRRNLNLTDTARALHTSQPGVSKAIIELEEELGIEIFARHGKRPLFSGRRTSGGKGRSRRDHQYGWWGQACASCVFGHGTFQPSLARGPR